MTQELSRLILQNHDANEKAINDWFLAIINESITFCKPSTGKGFARFLYTDAPGRYLVSRVDIRKADDVAYAALIRNNYKLGFPILACSVVLPISQHLKDKEELCLLITKEFPYISRRQIWIEMRNPETNNTQMILDHYYSINAVLPEHIQRFAHIIQPFNRDN